jgi:hypothetical protein
MIAVTQKTAACGITASKERYYIGNIGVLRKVDYPVEFLGYKFCNRLLDFRRGTPPISGPRTVSDRFAVKKKNPVAEWRIDESGLKSALDKKRDMRLRVRRGPARP